MIPKGESKTVTFELNANDLAYWDNEKDTFIVESGSVNVMIGASSEDIRLVKKITIK